MGKIWKEDDQYGLSAFIEILETEYYYLRHCLLPLHPQVRKDSSVSKGSNYSRFQFTRG